MFPAPRYVPRVDQLPDRIGLRIPRTTWIPAVGGGRRDVLTKRQPIPRLVPEPSGHDPDYQRSIPVNGVTYIVTGSGSGTRRTGAADFTAESFAWLGFVDIGVYPDRLVVRSLSEDLEMTDEIEIAPDGAVTELGP